MVAQRWEKLKEIFGAAMDVPEAERSAWLDSACGGDSELRGEVERLLRQQSGADLYSPLSRMQAGESSAGSTLTLVEGGAKLGSFEILERIGSGGMGEVWRARDVRLKRDVAIKILPAAFARDPDRVARFERESRTAGLLNHPNLVTVHDIGHEGNVYWIVSEFIHGQPLSAILTHGPLSPRHAVEIAVQVAAGLAAAHAAGIVHRDLKPANIMIAENGAVKVVDFGLAKLTETADPSVPTCTANDEPLTEEGEIVGTVAYMSPEQAEGSVVDGRSDIFSLGAVLYEMLSRRRAFERETRMRTLSAVLSEDPAPLSSIAPTMPVELERIVTRCLRKDPGRRFQHMDDLRVALEEVKDEFSSASTARDRAQQRPRTPFLRIAVSATLVLLLAAGILWWRLRPPGAPFQQVAVEMLTSSGDVGEGAISPDGRYVAHTSFRGEEQSIWMRQLKADAKVEIVPPVKAQLSSLHFSRDGEYLYYRQAAQRSQLFRIPSLGGPAELLLDDVGAAATVSPDEQRIAYLSHSPDRGDSVIVATLKAGVRKAVFTRAEPAYIRPQIAWSPDGALLALPFGSFEDWTTERVLILPVNGAPVRLFSPVHWAWVAGTAWLPNGRGLLISAMAEGGGPQVWLAPWPSGRARQLTHDTSWLGGPIDVAADSLSFVTVVQSCSSEVWVTAPGTRSPSAVTATSPHDEGFPGITWTPDGRLVYSSQDRDNLHLWLANADLTNRRRLTSGYATLPAATADGRAVYFVSDQGGPLHIRRMNLDGSNAVQVTDGHGEQWPSPSPDGKWLLYTECAMTGACSVWKMALPSGVPARFGDLKDSGPAIVSPDGNWVALSYTDSRFQPPRGIGLMRMDGTGFRALNLPATWGIGWSSDASALFLVKSDRGVDNIWKEPIAGGQGARITSFTSGSIGPIAVSRDERLAFAHYHRLHDLVLIRSVR